MKKLQKNDIIKTERLILKLAPLSDAKVMHELIDDSVTEFMVWSKGEDYKSVENNLIESYKESDEGKSWQATIYLHDGTIIGRFGMHTIDDEKNSIMLGYWMTRAHRGNGYISECVEWVKKYGFEEMGLDKIGIRCVKENAGSRAVAIKGGFQLDGIMRHDEIQKGQLVDNCYFSYLRAEYT